MTEVLNQTNLDKNYIAAFGARFPVSSQSDDPMVAFRAAGMKAFSQQGVPGSKHEEYRFIPLAKHIEKHFDFTQASPEGRNTNLDTFLIEGLNEYRIVFVNGKFSKALSTTPESGEGYSFQLLSDTNPDIIKTHLGNYAKAESDAFVAANAALMDGGIFLHIQKNKEVERPFMIYFVQDTEQGTLHQHLRNLVVVEQGAKATLVEKYIAIGTNAEYSNMVTEVKVAENAEFHLVRIQDHLEDSFHIGNTHLHQENNSRTYSTVITTSGSLVRNNMHVTLDGENCEAHMMGLYLVKGKTHLDNHTVVDHRKPHSYSNELYKGILDERAKGVFNGKIYVRPNAQKTNAFQSNKNVLLTDTATINTKPQLEIWADDVKCSHGCTTGQLDIEALFYLQSRGLDKASARALLLHAFAVEVLESIAQEPLKKYLEHIISKRLNKNF
jgi:Fe-S cluster assembly protein SufD